MKKQTLIVLAVFSPWLASAAIVGPYTPDANTTYLFHLDEGAGSTVAVNAGSAGYSAILYAGNPYAGDGLDQPSITGGLGNPGFSGFGAAAQVGGPFDAGFGLGVDISGNGRFSLDDNDPIGVDRLTDHSSIFGTGNAFTLEAMINLPAITGSNHEIISTDSSAGNADRGFQFRINSAGNLEFNFVGVNTSAISAAIPTTGDHAFVADEWFHVGLSYDGANATFYWTRLNDAYTAANAIGGPTAEGVDINDDAVLVFGNEGRVVGTTGSTEGLQGLIDEIRISDVARGADEFLFAVPEPSTWALLGLGAIVGLLRLRRKSRLAERRDVR